MVSCSQEILPASPESGRLHYVGAISDDQLRLPLLGIVQSVPRMHCWVQQRYKGSVVDGRDSVPDIQRHLLTVLAGRSGCLPFVLHRVFSKILIPIIWYQRPAADFKGLLRLSIIGSSHEGFGIPAVKERCLPSVCHVFMMIIQCMGGTSNKFLKARITSFE